LKEEIALKKWILFLAIAVLTLGLVPPAAQSLTLDSVGGTWSNPVGTTATLINDVPILYGNGFENQARWGTPAGSGGQSGLGFTGVAPPATSFPPEIAFELGQLRHFNNPTTGNPMTSIQLNVPTVFSDPPVSPSFTFTFAINETPNTTGDPYLDRDFIYFPSAFPTQTFDIGGTMYTLKLLGFGDNAGSLFSQFESNEGGTNATLLWGKITTEVVPLPGAVWLLGSGLLGLAGLRLRVRKR
jgi:hypothetical protein